MKWKNKKENKSPDELGITGLTTAEVFQDLMKKSPARFSKLKLSDETKIGLEKDSITNRVRIIFPKGMEIDEFETNRISKMAVQSLLAQRSEQETYIRRNIEIRIHMNSINESVWITNGHLPWSIDNEIIKMNPQISSCDESYIRTIVPHTDDLYNMDQYLHSIPQNRILKRSEPNKNYPEIIKNLGFEIKFKEDSRIQVSDDGEEDTCVVTRVCPYPDEIIDEGNLIKCVIDTIDRASAIEKNLIIKIAMANSLDLTISNNRRELILTLPAYEGYVCPTLLQNLIGDILETFDISKIELENSIFEYNTMIQIEDTIVDKFFSRAGEFVEGIIGITMDMLEKNEEKIILGATLLSMPLIFLYLLFSNSVNPESSFFVSTIIALPAFILSYLVSVLTGSGTDPLEICKKKRFPTLFWTIAGATYVIVDKIGFLAYLAELVSLLVIIGELAIGAIFAYAILSGLLYLTKPFRKYLSDNKVVERIIKGKTMSILGRIALILAGIVIAVIFNIAAIPLKVLYSINEFRDNNYWEEINSYQRKIIENSLGKKRADLELAIPCKIYVNLKNCRKFRNPFKGGLKVLSSRMPDFLTWEGYIKLNWNLVKGKWM